MNHTLFDPITKVYEGLGRKLPIGLPIVVHIDRYSAIEEGGIASQVGRSTRALVAGRDPDVVAYLTIPAEAWTSDRTDLHARYGIAWLRLKDIHPAAVGTEDMGGIVLIGRTLFCRLTTGSTAQQIVRRDGDDENCLTVFVLAMAAHYGASIKRFRWTDDARRAGRDSANWSAIVRRCRERGIGIEFGGKLYDAATDHILLSLLGSMAQQDDVTRRMSLGGGRLEHLLAGGAGMAEQQMPYGYAHQRHGDGRRVRNEHGYVPMADASMLEVVRTAWTMLSTGEDYAAIGRYLGDLAVHRRGTAVPPGSTFADLLGRPGEIGDSAKSFFVNRARSAHTEQELYLGKLTLMTTGTWPYRVANDIAQRDVKVAGLVPTYRDEHDPRGWFDLSLAWGWPKDPATGLDIVRWGLSTEQLQACRERLVGELRAPRTKPAPGHNLATDRALSDFGIWVAQDGRYAGEATEYGVGPRQLNSGRNNTIVMHRRVSEGLAPNGKPRGWQNQNRSSGVAWTFNLDELCGDLAQRINKLVEDGLLNPAAVMPASVIRAPGGAGEQRERRAQQLTARLTSAQDRHDDLVAETIGLRTAAGKFAAKDDDDKFAEYDLLADAKAQEAQTVRQEIAQMTARLQAVQTEPEPAQDEQDEVDLSLAAYLVAGLHRAASANGRGPSRLRLTTAASLTQWTFTQVAPAVLAYGVTLALPLRDGGHTQHQLCGQVRDVRGSIGRTAATADLVAAAILRDGRAVGEVATSIGKTTRAQLFMRHLMPWLRDHGVTSRGAKCAIADHPFNWVKAVVYAAAAGTHDPSLDAWPQPIRELIAEVYTDPDLAWGDSAVADDLKSMHQLVATLALGHVRAHGLAITEAAMLLGISDNELRRKVVPAGRTAGFARPQYLDYTPGSAKQRVQAIVCPHGRCRGLCDVVVLLPEVARSGYGVICSTCRRAPNTAEARWSRLAFPDDYTQPFTGPTGTTGSLRLAGQTYPAATVHPFQVTRQR
jgi:hypothetical protein